MTETAEISNPALMALLQEHEELVQLYVHEDTLAWQLNLALLAANAGLFAATNSLDVLDSTKPIGFPLLVVLAVGALMNIVGFFVLQRSKIHRMSRLFRAYRVEAELAKAGIPIRTFGSAEGIISAGRMLEPPEKASSASAADPTRSLRFKERVEFLDLRFAFNVLAIAFLALGLWVALGRPWL